jgi:hypothetical protein
MRLVSGGDQTMCCCSPAAHRNAPRGLARCAGLGIMLLVLSLAGCQISTPATSPGSVAGLCVRHDNVGYWSVDDEMNQTYIRCHAQPNCRSFGPAQTMIVAGAGSVYPWLFSGGQNATFSIAQQDAYISQAKQNAVALQPSGKVIKALTFQNSIVVGGASGYFLAATASYAACFQNPNA